MVLMIFGTRKHDYHFPRMMIVERIDEVWI